MLVGLVGGLFQWRFVVQIGVHEDPKGNPRSLNFPVS
jgi:hypothetical protein